MKINTILIIIFSIIILFYLFRSHITLIHTQLVKPVFVKPIGGCAGTRYGCCPNGATARVNPAGTNC
jgi:hypothetical protein